MRIGVSLVLVAALMVSSPAFAGKKGNNGKKAHGAPAVQVHSDEAVATLITATERSIILGYLGSRPISPATAQPLPPGIAKKLARGGSLPPGIAKRYLPNDLLVQLPPRPGYQWVVVDRDVVLVAVATGLIVDVLLDVF